MKRIGILAALAAALASSGAYAADPFAKGSTKDDGDVFASPGVVNWTGFYVGVQGGYGNANHNLSVQDYFKDYCGLNLPGIDKFGPQKALTLDNLHKVQDLYGVDAGEVGRLESCEEKIAVAETQGSPAVLAKTGLDTVSGDSREVGSIDGVNSHGFLGGGRVGFDMARGRLLFGVFAEYNITNMETDVNIAGIGSFGLEKQDEWTIGGRIGYIVAPRTLAYVLAGYTQTEYDVTGLDNAAVAPLFTSLKGGATFDGITVGGGVEFALTGNVFLGMEYTHTFYDEETILDGYNANFNQGLKVVDDLDEDKIMATLKIKLNGSLFGN